MINISLEELAGKLRLAARVAGKKLGFVSSETPIPIGRYRLALVCRRSTVCATAA